LFVVVVTRLIRVPPRGAVPAIEENTMNPVITQALAAEKIRGQHAHAASWRRARLARRPRPGLRAVPGLLAMPGLRARRPASPRAA
jgi:hypothetical protein